MFIISVYSGIVICYFSCIIYFDLLGYTCLHWNNMGVGKHYVKKENVWMTV